MPKKTFKEGEWTLKPFITIEGLTEVYLHDEVYRMNIHFLTNASGDRAGRWMSRVFEIKEGGDHPRHLAGSVMEIRSANNGLHALVITMPDVWTGSQDQIITLMHEMYHVTSFTLFSRGLKHDRDISEEAFSYFQESLVKRFWNALKLKPIKYNPKNKHVTG